MPIASYSNNSGLAGHRSFSQPLPVHRVDTPTSDSAAVWDYSYSPYDFGNTSHFPQMEANMPIASYGNNLGLANYPSFSQPLLAHQVDAPTFGSATVLHYYHSPISTFSGSTNDNSLVDWTYEYVFPL
jgi:hypothetical protein